MAKAPTPLRVAIAASGLSQRELAAKVGIHESRMSLIVNGLHPDDDLKRKIADALGRDDVDELFRTAVAA